MAGSRQFEVVHQMIVEAVVQREKVVHTLAGLHFARVLACEARLELAAGQMIVQIDEVALRVIAVAAQVHLLDLGSQLLQIVQILDVTAVAVDVLGGRQSAGTNTGHCFRQIVQLDRVRVQVLEHLTELLRVGELDQLVVVVREFLFELHDRSFRVVRVHALLLQSLLLVQAGLHSALRRLSVAGRRVVAVRSGRAL